MSRGIVLRKEDKNIQQKSISLSIPLSISEPKIVYERNLILREGTEVPWSLVHVGFQFLGRWDACVPLWKYNELAAWQGTPRERKITQEVAIDNRVLLHSAELLFVKDNEPGRELVSQWNYEMDRGDGDFRLAFLRAVHVVKPRLCILPTSWLAPIRDSWKVSNRRSSVDRPASPLVRVEVAPGRYVKCREGDIQKVLDAFKQQQGGRK